MHRLFPHSIGAEQRRRHGRQVTSGNVSGTPSAPPSVCPEATPPFGRLFRARPRATAPAAQAATASAARSIDAAGWGGEQKRAPTAASRGGV
eukprot:gene15741-biopygen12261